MTKARETKDNARRTAFCTSDEPAGNTRRPSCRRFGEPAFYESVSAEGAEVVG